MAGKGLFWKIFALPDLVITIRESAAREADRKIRGGAEQSLESQFRIDVNRRDGQAQGEIRAHERRLVIVVKGVGGEGGVPFQRLIVTKLDQFAFDRVDLGVGGERGEHARQKQDKKPAPDI